MNRAVHCSKDHTKLTTRDVFYREYGVWGCLECGAYIRENAIVRTEAR